MQPGRAAGRVDAGIGHDDVQAAQLFDAAVDRGGDLGEGGDVGDTDDRAPTPLPYAARAVTQVVGGIIMV